jgi:excinuclease UvrABC nuclease subunit
MADTTQVEIPDGRIIDAPTRAVKLYNDGDTAALTAFISQYYKDNPAPSSSTAPSSSARDVSAS